MQGERVELVFNYYFFL